MLSVNSTKILQKNRFFSPNADINKDWYVYAGHDSVYIRGYLRYPIFNDFKNINYYRNIFPINKTPALQRFDWELYTGSLYDYPSLSILASKNFDSVFGYKLPSEVNFAWYDISNRILKTRLGDVYDHPIDVYCVGIFNNDKLNRQNYGIIFNGITYGWWNPKYEVPLYPLSYGTQLLFEKQNKNSVEIEYYTNITGLPYIWTIPKPKYMIKYYGSFLTYNFGTNDFVQFTPSGTYMTKTELETNGNTYSELINIPSSSWDSFDVEEIQLFTNGFLMGYFISNNLWIDNLDIQQFKRLYSKDTKNVWVYGEI